MKITDRLKAEHGIFLYQLDRLQDLARAKAPLTVLAAVVEMIASAEDHHALVEDTVLYPALVEANGGDFPLLRKSQAQHAQLRRLARRIRSEDFNEHMVTAFAALLRDHLEREIHGLFALAEELLPEEKLAALGNWDADHMREAAVVSRPLAAAPPA